MTEPKEKYDCLFCNSKCPECGSEAISVRFKVEWEYDNENLNSIYIYQGDDSIEVECHDCGEIYHLDEFGYDRRLLPLRNALSRGLDLPGKKFFEIDEENHIKETEFVREIFPCGEKGGG